MDLGTPRAEASGNANHEEGKEGGGEGQTRWMIVEEGDMVMSKVKEMIMGLQIGKQHRGWWQEETWEQGKGGERKEEEQERPFAMKLDAEVAMVFLEVTGANNDTEGGSEELESRSAGNNKKEGKNVLILA